MNEPSPNDGFYLSSEPRHIKKCPKCTTGQLVIRTNHDTGERFLGCNNFMSGNCKHTESLPLDVLLREQGAPTLPGLE